MKKIKFLLYMLQRRIANIVLLSLMFSALLFIFMVGLSIKDVFYNYMKSDYGNIPDMKAKLHNLPQSQMLKIKSQIKQVNQNIDIFYGYEAVFPLTLIDSDDNILANKMPILVKGITLEKKLNVQIDGKKHFLKIKEFSYDDGLYIELYLDGVQVEDKDSLVFLSKGKVIPFTFCTKIDLTPKTIILTSRYCRDKVDDLFDDIKEKEATSLVVDIDGKKQKLKIKELDVYDRSIGVKYSKTKEPKHIEVLLDNLSIDERLIDSFEVYNHILYIIFKRDENLELKYKRFIAQIVKDQINYERFVLKVKNYSFSEDDAEDRAMEKQNQELNRLNKLTDFIDMINFKNGNLAIASEYLANDLNNFGLLDNFTIQLQNNKEFLANIRSTFYYKPERYYDKNIFIFNNKVLNNEFGIKDKNNYLDVYVDDEDILPQIKEIIVSFDKEVTFLYQEDIIPSIMPKKQIFQTVFYSFSGFILIILFIAIYVVIRQFYSNFESELALFKLFGSNQPYQTYINIISLFISASITYFLLKQEEVYIDTLMRKYFFTSYYFDMKNYFIALGILGIYIVIIYFVELILMKKLNIIKGQ
ncbi:hypothetical protein MNB_SM-3-15 [hydrothermal vent metagenome]|uniref:Uncharacterized protein n=1 Tax=hydrothermal vent metagenome TaxID=652676 RepID=A0A1W1D4C0_9ZZZZ